MATVQDVVTRAMRMIGVVAGTETLRAEDAEAGRMSLNGLLAAWELEGIRLALPPLTLATEIPLPDAHVDAATWNLAVRLCAEFGRQVPPAIAATAADGKRGLRTAYAFMPELRAETMWMSNARGLPQ